MGIEQTDLLRQTDAQEGDVLPLPGIVAPVTSPSTQSTTFSRVDAGDSIFRANVDTLLPNPAQLRIALAGRFLTGSGETYTIRIRDTNNFNTLASFKFTASTEIQTDWQDAGYSKNVASLGQYEPEHKTEPATTTSETQQLVVFWGYEL